jgi:hypothetical protein
VVSWFNLLADLARRTFRVTVQEVGDDGRARPLRTNMFVMATIYAGGGSAPVKIRNLSTTGALIEGTRIPPQTAEISLRRGGLNVTGKVVWCSNGRAGLEFESPISVAHWLPGGEALVEQERIDAVFHGATGQGEPASGPVELTQETVTVAEILKSKAMLEALADALADDADVLVRHGGQIQALDLAIQVLGKLAGVSASST